MINAIAPYWGRLAFSGKVAHRFIREDTDAHTHLTVCGIARPTGDQWSATGKPRCERCDWRALHAAATDVEMELLDRREDDQRSESEIAQDYREARVQDSGNETS